MIAGSTGNRTIKAPGGTLMKHMPKTMYTQDPEMLKGYDRSLVPDTDTYQLVTHWEIYEELMFNITRFLGENAVDAVHFVLSTKTDRKTNIEHIGGSCFMLLVMKVNNGGREGDDLELCCGIQNSIDGLSRLIIVFGTHVFVCDNLSMSGSIFQSHRHTKNVIHAMPGMIRSACSEAPSVLERESHFRADMMDVKLNQAEGFDMLHDLYLQGLLSGAGKKPAFSPYGLAVEQWKRPSYGVFEDANAWSLYNACTYAMTRADTKITSVLKPNKAINDAFRHQFLGATP